MNDPPQKKKHFLAQTFSTRILFVQNAKSNLFRMIDCAKKKKSEKENDENQSSPEQKKIHPCTLENQKK